MIRASRAGRQSPRHNGRRDVTSEPVPDDDTTSASLDDDRGRVGIPWGRRVGPTGSTVGRYAGAFASGGRR